MPGEKKNFYYFGNSIPQIGYDCDPARFKCIAPSGKVLLESITMYTVDCVGCTSEGAIVSLLGERTITYQTGVPCTTASLDLLGSTEYASGGSFQFTDEEQLGICHEVTDKLKCF